MAATKPTSTTATFNLGTCPCCKRNIVANVNFDIDVKLGSIDYRAKEGTAHVNISGDPKIRSIVVRHECVFTDDKAACDD